MAKRAMRGSSKFKINPLLFCSTVSSLVFSSLNTFLLSFYLELVYNWSMIWFHFATIWSLMLVFLHRHGHKNTVLSVKWNSNGNWVLTASRDQTIKVSFSQMMYLSWC